MEFSCEFKGTNLLHIKKAAYKYTDTCCVDFLPNEDSISCIFSFKEEITSQEFNKFLIDFKNDVLDEELRETIKEDTEPVRNLILSYAFSKVDFTEDV